MRSWLVNRRVRSAACDVEALESRCLLSATVIAQIPAQSLTSGTLGAPLALNNFFNDPTVTGTAVELQTSEGNIPLVLTDAATPQTVANFLQYVNSGAYANTIIHRTEVPPSSMTPLPFIIQGGGYTTNGTHISTNAMIPGESANPGALTNTTGTIAMALSSGPNTATGEWFINLSNNNGSNGNPNLDNTSDSGPFTAFGTVVYNGMEIANTIANLPQVNASVESAAWTNLPVLPSYTGPSTATANIPANNLVTVTPVVIPGGLTYSVSSSNPNLVSGSISNGALSLTPAVGAGSGNANVTVTATDMGGGTATSTFAVNVLNTSPNVTIGAGAAKSVTYKDANGTVAVVSEKGPGTAVVTFNGTGISQTNSKNGISVNGTGLGISSIAASGVTSASTLMITTRGGANAVDVGLINAGSLKSIIAKSTTLIGSLNSTGAIGSISLAGASGGTIGAISIGNFSTPGAFSDDVDLSGSGLDLSKFIAGSIVGGMWTVGGSAGSISAGSASDWAPTFIGGVKSLTISGAVTGDIAAAAIATFTVKSAIANSQIHLTGAGNDLNKLIVGGAFSQSVIVSLGSIGTIDALALTSGQIYAGIGSLSDGLVLPGAVGDFASMASIKSITLKGTSGGASFANSDIAAAKLGVLSLGTLQTSGNGGIAGIVGETIQLLTAIANKKFTLKNLTSGSNITALVDNQDVMLGQIVIQAV